MSEPKTLTNRNVYSYHLEKAFNILYALNHWKAKGQQLCNVNMLPPCLPVHLPACTGLQQSQHPVTCRCPPCVHEQDLLEDQLTRTPKCTRGAGDKPAPLVHFSVRVNRSSGKPYVCTCGGQRRFTEFCDCCDPVQTGKCACKHGSAMFTLHGCCPFTFQ